MGSALKISNQEKSYVKHNNNFNLIRLVAATQVMLVHCFNHFGIDNLAIRVLKGLPGVPLFFFISGYLISMAYERKQKSGLMAFFINRTIRIHPALIVCVTLTTIAVYLTGYYMQNEIDVLKIIAWTIGQATFFQIYNPEFMRGFGLGVANGALWTIFVELQFYVLTPFLFFLMRRVKLFVFILFAISVSVNIYFRLYLNWDLLIHKLGYTSFIPWVYMFLLGFFVNYYKWIIPNLRKLGLITPLVFYVLSMMLIGDYSLNAQNGINPIAVCFMVIIVFNLAYMKLSLPNEVKNFLDKNDISYGIYIYHMPIINMFLFWNNFSLIPHVIATIFITFVFAFYSWRIVEKPILKFKRG